jgi:hypothetical protein
MSEGCAFFPKQCSKASLRFGVVRRHRVHRRQRWRSIHAWPEHKMFECLQTHVEEVHRSKCRPNDAPHAAFKSQG